MSDINTEYTKEIICPYCGHKFSDSWEYNEDNGCIIGCESCDEHFLLILNHDVTYCTEKQGKAIDTH